MALKLDYLVPIGFLKKTRKFIPAHYSFKKLLGEVLNWLNVPFADPCCDAMSDSVPVRYNKLLGRLEFYNNVTDVWSDIYSITEVTTTTTTSTTTTTTVP